MLNRPAGINIMTRTKITPWYSNQVRVMSETAYPKNVITAAPRAGPKNAPIPPIYEFSTTWVDKDMSNNTYLAASLFMASKAPANPKNETEKEKHRETNQK